MTTQYVLGLTPSFVVGRRGFLAQGQSPLIVDGHPMSSHMCTSYVSQNSGKQSVVCPVPLRVSCRVFVTPLHLTT